jgi:RND family efflux transporter MFP subunit
MFTKILATVLGFFTVVFKKFIAFGKKFGWVKVSLALIALVILGWTLAYFLGGKPAEEVSINESRSVTLKSVAELSSESSPLLVAGVVSSKSQAQVRAEAGGRITAVNYTLGDYVGAGAIIAQTENASQRAAVAQALGAVNAASAGSSVSQTGLESAKQSAVATLLSAYGTVDKTIRADTDPMFSNPSTIQPQFSVQSSDSQSKINAESIRVSLTQILKRQAGQAGVSASADLSAEITRTLGELRTILDYLDTILKTLNSGIATNGVPQATINAYITTANTDRAAIVAAISALASAQASIENAQTGAQQGTGTSAAGLAQAEAGLASARAALEKTIIRAPISGSINSLSLKVGDYLSAGTVAVVIANNGALEVISYVTPGDAQEIAPGTTVSIETPNGTVKATITRIAPAIDPATKKIEVRIGITEKANLLINGQSVTVSIPRVQKTAGAVARITLPLSALKVGADTISVFTVDENKKLVSHLVTLGTLLGDRVVIESGVDASMQIVTDARGLQPGQVVTVK